MPGRKLASSAAFACVIAGVALAIALWGARPAGALPLRFRGAWPNGAAKAAEVATGMASGQIVQAARPRLLGARRVTGRERVGYVAFTFDDGPHRDTTPSVLATLAAHEVPAAFFVCGYQMDGDTEAERANARALDAVIAAGHLVGNHTFVHTRLEHATLAAAWQALSRNEHWIAPHLGRASRLFRPPYGKLSRVAERLLDDLGYTIVRWSIDPGDTTERAPTAIRDDVLAAIFAEGGGVVLLHDVKPWTVKALPLILAGLERENCRRLARGKQPILPVSLDYFAVDWQGAPLPLPPEVEAQTQRTRAALTRRCKPARRD